MSSRLILDTKELARFLVRAKKNAWAGDRGKTQPERAGFKEYIFTDGEWSYRDSYVGFYCAPGQEIVRFQEQPVWTMSYDGGMAQEFWEDENFARETFVFLKKALLQVEESMPFRGPERYEESNLVYKNCLIDGDIRRFEGEESIISTSTDALIFQQKYIGGLIVTKGGIEIK